MSTTEKYYNEELNFKISESGYFINVYNYELEIDTEIYVPNYHKEKLQKFLKDMLEMIKENKDNDI